MFRWFSKLALRTKIIYISGVVVVLTGAVGGVLYLTGNNIFASTASGEKICVSVGTSKITYSKEAIGPVLEDIYDSSWSRDGSDKTAPSRLYHFISGDKKMHESSDSESKSYSYSSGACPTITAPKDDQGIGTAESYVCVKVSTGDLVENYKYSWMTESNYNSCSKIIGTVGAKPCTKVTNGQEIRQCGTKPTTAPTDDQGIGGASGTILTEATGSKACVIINGKGTTYTSKGKTEKKAGIDYSYSSWSTGTKIEGIPLYVYYYENKMHTYLKNSVPAGEQNIEYVSNPGECSTQSATTDASTISITVYIANTSSKPVAVNNARITAEAFSKANGSVNTQVCITGSNGKCSEDIKMGFAPDTATAGTRISDVARIVVTAEKPSGKVLDSRILDRTAGSGEKDALGRQAVGATTTTSGNKFTVDFQVKLTDVEAAADADYTAIGGSTITSPISIPVTEPYWPGGNNSVTIIASRPSQASSVKGRNGWTPVGGVGFEIDARTNAKPVKKTGMGDNSIIAYAAASDLIDKKVTITIDAKDKSGKAVSGAQVHYKIYTDSNKTPSEFTIINTDANGKAKITRDLGKAGGNTWIDAVLYRGDTKLSSLDTYKIADMENSDFVLDLTAESSVTQTGKSPTASTTPASGGGSLGQQTTSPFNYQAPYFGDYVAPYNRAKFNEAAKEYSYSYTLNGIIPDNGTNSGIILTNLPDGIYHITLSKSGFSNTDFIFKTEKGEQTSFGSLSIIPNKGVEPPSIESGEVKKDPEKDLYHATVGGTQYAYVSVCPWFGWQEESKLSENKLLCVKPAYPGNDGVPSYIDSDGKLAGGVNNPEFEKCVKGKMESLSVSAKGLSLGDILGILGGAYLVKQSEKQKDQWVQTGMMAGGIAALFYTAKNSKSEWNINYDKYEECLSKLSNTSLIPSECYGCQFVMGVIPISKNCPAKCIPFSPGLGTMLPMLKTGN